MIIRLRIREHGRLECTRSCLDYDIADYRDDNSSPFTDASGSEEELLDLSSNWTAATSFDGDASFPPSTE